jgi:hypothetical protein
MFAFARPLDSVETGEDSPLRRQAAPPKPFQELSC